MIPTEKIRYLFSNVYEIDMVTFYYKEPLDGGVCNGVLSIYSDEDGNLVVRKDGHYHTSHEAKVLRVLSDISGVVEMVEDAVFIDSNNEEVVPGNGTLFLKKYEGDLSQLLSSNKLKRKEAGALAVPFILEDAIPNMVRLLTALEIIHSLRICHNDIKPNNIFYDKDGIFYLGDFDISTMFEQKDMDRFFAAKKDYADGVEREYVKELSFYHDAITYIYGPPENLLIDDFGSAQGPKFPIADIWSLGCVFFEMLTGRRFNTNTFHLTEDRKGLIWKEIDYFRKYPTWLSNNVTSEMNREGFSIYAKRWKELKEPDSYPATKAVCSYQEHAVADKSISDETKQHLTDLFVGMLDPNFLTRLSAKECLKNPLFKDHLHISDAMWDGYLGPDSSEDL